MTEMTNLFSNTRILVKAATPDDIATLDKWA